MGSQIVPPLPQSLEEAYRRQSAVGTSRQARQSEFGLRLPMKAEWRSTVIRFQHGPVPGASVIFLGDAKAL